MNQITLTLQNAVDRVGHIPGNLGHPEAIGDRRDAGDLHQAGRQLDEEQNHKPLQTFSGPHLTVKKSAATSSSPCGARNSFQVVFFFRSDAGSAPCRFNMSAIVSMANYKNWRSPAVLMP